MVGDGAGGMVVGKVRWGSDSGWGGHDVGWGGVIDGAGWRFVRGGGGWV